MEHILTNIDLFSIINEYIGLRNLCDTCVLLSLLKKHVDYKLKNKYSQQYYDDELFRNKVLSKIFNPNKQLYLIIIDCDNITNVSVFGNQICNLQLYYCKKVTDVSAFRNIHTLKLREYLGITDVIRKRS